MESRLTILYRGPLASCNYRCEYCPFAKQQDSTRELQVDRRCLDRFVHWVALRHHRSHAVFFTPWGEALIRPWYRQALIRLSRLSHVRRVAVQTNLSCSVEWLAEADRTRMALWCTYHPSQVARRDFVDQCTALTRLGIRYSVGVVGVRDHFGEIEALRDELPADVYLWVNAYQQVKDYYGAAELKLLAAIDPLFPLNVMPHTSLGEYCRAGETVISVDGSGNVRRCHFINDILGNIYERSFDQCLQRRHCSNATCGCHIGYVHLEKLKLYDVFGPNVLERIPVKKMTNAPRINAQGPMTNAPRINAQGPMTNDQCTNDQCTNDQCTNDHDQ